MDKVLKQDDSVFKALDLKVIRRLICKTDKGELELAIRKGEKTYFLTLDSVPLEKDVNKELMGVLFPTMKLEPQKVKKEPIEIIKPEAKQYYKKPKAEFPIKTKGGIATTA